MRETQKRKKNRDGKRKRARDNAMGRKRIGMDLYNRPSDSSSRNPRQR